MCHKFLHISRFPAAGRRITVDSGSAATFIIITGIILFCIVMKPIENPLFTICLFKLITGIDCPTCGITRSLIYLFHGDITNAVRMNPLGIPVFVLLLYQFIKLSLQIFFHTNVRINVSKQMVIVITLISFMSILLVWYHKLSTLSSVF